MKSNVVLETLCIAVMTAAATGNAAALVEDPFIWLEEVTGEQALDWVRAQNAVTIKELEKSPAFEPIRSRLLQILDSKDKIPHITKHGPWFYNFWRDEQNPRGLWRRTTLDEYRNARPKWETVLDLDALGAKEEENWVWKGADVLFPSYDRAMLHLSRGGADAVVVREFDLNSKQFVDAGFFLKEAKTRIAWKDKDTLYVRTDFGAGSLTTSGYPRIIKEWKRNTPLEAARLVLEGKTDDVWVSVTVTHDQEHTYEFIGRHPSFYTSLMQLRQGQKWVEIEKPDDTEISTFKDQLILSLRSEWTVDGKTFPAGSLLACPLKAYLEGKREMAVLFTPTERSSLAATSRTKNFLLLNELRNVQSRLSVLDPASGKWIRTELDTPAYGNLSVTGVDHHESDDFFLTVSDFLSPATLYLGTVGKSERENLKSMPAFFRTNGLEITQHQAISKDGTRIPYFQVAPADLGMNGQNPTLLYGYGGFEIPMLPSYAPGTGVGWLERGGVYVLANIRGGGEFGPKWHQAALKQKRQRAYDDFAAVAEDLIKRKLTSPQRLGIQGGSNGGLLTGVMLTQRPELFGAVVSQVPLLDMRRYNQLLAGASWMAEYGNPDLPEEWAFIRRYSPYQNLSKEREYPPTLITTSTRDDRVHPGHARKMTARMLEQGHKVLYYENIEGGHGGAADNKQAAYMSALAYTFLGKTLGIVEKAGP